MARGVVALERVCLTNCRLTWDHGRALLRLLSTTKGRLRRVCLADNHLSNSWTKLWSGGPGGEGWRAGGLEGLEGVLDRVEICPRGAGHCAYSAGGLGLH